MQRMYEHSYYTSELYHYGVKGMKWGHRKRYYDASGNLNARGIKKYAKKGYAQDSYNSNKTKLGKAYDKVTSAHKYSGEMMYDLSSKKANKARAEKYVADKQKADDAKAAYKQAKKDYNKAYNKAYNYSSTHAISQFVGKKQKAESDRRWGDAADAAKRLDDAKKAYKNAKSMRESSVKNISNSQTTSRGRDSVDNLLGRKKK